MIASTNSYIDMTRVTLFTVRVSSISCPMHGDRFDHGRDHRQQTAVRSQTFASKSNGLEAPILLASALTASAP